MRRIDPHWRPIERREGVVRGMASSRFVVLARARVVVVVARANWTRACVETRQGFHSSIIARGRGAARGVGVAFGDVLGRREGARSRPRRIEG